MQILKYIFAYVSELEETVGVEDTAVLNLKGSKGRKK